MEVACGKHTHTQTHKHKHKTHTHTHTHTTLFCLSSCCFLQQRTDVSKHTRACTHTHTAHARVWRMEQSVFLSMKQHLRTHHTHTLQAPATQLGSGIF
eukprot:TRINITY_DN7773_c2_g1_i1.p2 TRINITY_DN7773_c2_g1~~TRINITY_DN7773_c2_g1_i1.p2  ORF type:complete len:109 (+),score=20.39 TRINITY_DN7773_c2_g1_i1:35-328(+)